MYVELLDRNDNRPRFTQDEYISAVWEGNSKGTFVVQVSTELTQFRRGDPEVRRRQNADSDHPA